MKHHKTKDTQCTFIWNSDR